MQMLYSDSSTGETTLYNFARDFKMRHCNWRNIDCAKSEFFTVEANENFDIAVDSGSEDGVDTMTMKLCVNIKLLLSAITHSQPAHRMTAIHFQFSIPFLYLLFQ